MKIELSRAEVDTLLREYFDDKLGLFLDEREVVIVIQSEKK